MHLSLGVSSRENMLVFRLARTLSRVMVGQRDARSPHIWRSGPATAARTHRLLLA
ncbi:hypothetical protein RGR602_PC01629 (plasmid) [Rhizobium gallicum bv. gallicum R602sp]|uniref:Uncharacterized protein n=1 Tax=Rhizobium gallicum bv. gallicum R602sp TaxID=1041138 RepID=A0A0B4XFW4_9HYPH|nr:hypothetical protein RGR602_PC01629 [Rhizobium gallicum bv. gallicum R602sp]